MPPHDVATRPLLCAGQGCGDRRNCLRYRMRHSGARWASFDIEHQKLEGGRIGCPVFLHASAQVRSVMQRKLR